MKFRSYSRIELISDSVFKYLLTLIKVCILHPIFNIGFFITSILAALYSGCVTGFTETEHEFRRRMEDLDYVDKEFGNE